MTFDDCSDPGRRELDDMEYEQVGMLRLNGESFERGGREVLEVLGDDDLSVAAHGCRQDVSVVGVRENKPFDERLVSGDEAVGDRLAHQLACPFELGSLEVRAAVENAADHLVEYLVCPAGSEEPGLGESDQQVPEAPAGWRTFAS